jgi:hypothetical protein
MTREEDVAPTGRRYSPGRYTALVIGWFLRCCFLRIISIKKAVAGATVYLVAVFFVT